MEHPVQMTEEYRRKVIRIPSQNTSVKLCIPVASAIAVTHSRELASNENVSVWLTGSS
jgi:hypothetical protein